MSAGRSQLEKKIDSQEREIELLKCELLKKESFLQGLREAFRLGPRDEAHVTHIFRHGTDMAKARDFLKKSGPSYVDDILKGIGKTVTKNARASLAGSIGTYVRKGEVFIKTAPNTFGLIEHTDRVNRQEDEPPDDFGSDTRSSNGKLDDDIPF